jgi:hypothetical protein
MSSPKTQTAPSSIRDGAKADTRRLENVRAIFAALSKYINAKTIYAGNSPVVARFAEAFDHALREFFQVEKELSLSVEQYQIKWRGETVYANRDKKESLAFLLYKDGVGEIVLQSTVGSGEIERFVDLIRNEICCPSSHLDIVSSLWQADFANISYRVFDECADGSAGTGRGSGGESGEQQLRADDHPGLSAGENCGGGNSALLSRSTESLARHLHAIVERDHPGESAHGRERYFQQLLESLFATRPEELAVWRQGFAAVKNRNKLLWLLDAMLDFTRMNNPAPVARDVLDIIHRLVRAIAEESDIRSLIAALELQESMAAGDDAGTGFESLPQRIKRELTNTSFLLALGKRAGRTRKDTREILEYFRLVGNNAVPALREILATSSDSSIHAEVCETLAAIARDYIMPIVEDLKLDNPLEAQDAIRLLQLCATREVPPVAEKIISSPDPRVRGGAIDYLARIGDEDAVLLLCRLLGDENRDVRVTALTAVEELKHPSIVAKVISLCFERDIEATSMEELERSFRTLGKLAGASAVPRLRRMAESRMVFALGGGRARQNKLLAITALRHIPGRESREILTRLAGDRDKLVRSKALRASSLQDERGAAEDIPATPSSNDGRE